MTSGVIAGTLSAFPLLSEVLDAAARARVLRVAYPKTYTPSEAERAVLTVLPCPSMGLGGLGRKGEGCSLLGGAFSVLRQLLL